MNLEPDFSDFLAALIKHKVEFVIVGAFALAHHGAPRATGDFDVWVRPERKNANAVLRALGDFGAPLTGLSEDDFLNGKIVQIGVEPVRIDVLNELSGVGAEEGAIGPHRVHFIGRKVYIKNKRACGRTKGLADLESLDEITRTIEPRRVVGLLHMGIKHVFRLTTALGKAIRTTGNHPYLTRSGWRKAADIIVGEEIATPSLEKVGEFLRREAGFSQDASQGSSGQLAVVRDDDSPSAARNSLLRYDVASALPDSDKPRLDQSRQSLAAGDRGQGHGLGADFEGGDQRLGGTQAFEFGWRSRLQIELYRLTEIAQGLVNGLPLAGYIELRAQGGIPSSFLFQNSGKLAPHNRNYNRRLQQPQEQIFWDRIVSIACP